MGESPGKLLSAINEAQAVIEAAEERATAIIDKAQITYEKAYDLGFQEGQEDGRQEAVKLAVRMLEESGAIGDSLAKHAASLAIVVARSIIGEQVKVDSKLVERIAMKALQSSIVGAQASLRVHPDDCKTLELARKKLERAAGGVGIVIESDPEVERGGCIVRTEFGEVDASIKSLLDVMASRMGVKRREKS